MKFLYWSKSEVFTIALLAWLVYVTVWAVV